MGKGKHKTPKKQHVNKWGKFSQAERVKTYMDSDDYQKKKADEAIRVEEERRRRAARYPPFNYGPGLGNYIHLRISPLPELLDLGRGIDDLFYS